MSSFIQDNRIVKVHTALGDNVLLFSSISGSEQLSTLFNYQLTLISEDPSLSLDDLLGTDITVELELFSGGSRFFHGYVAKCAHAGCVDQFTFYEFSVRPWLWFFTRTADCRIFQNMSVPDIIKQVFGEEGFTDYEDKLTASYEPWIYCVQYRETDFNFLSRLMEQEGIYYYFKHENGSHKLILSDSYSAHGTAAGYEDVPYFPVGGDQMRESDHLSHWNLRKQLEPGRFVVNDFDFKTPKGNLLADSIATNPHARADYEIYDYPGEYSNLAAGEIAADIRKETSHAQYEVANGGGNVQGLSAGNLFVLSNHDRADQNREYLITQSRIHFSLEGYRSEIGGELQFNCDIAAIDAHTPFRAPRVTPKPMVQGPQTAVVVGPPGEEIWTDEFGRVKLQFHWDRYGEFDENSSCWIRVSQIWAGKGWGAVHIPRIGHEVIVEFLEGDPDRPIITGRVYNGDNGVPYGLPANATQSGIKSRSSLSGVAANFNEIRMEDKKGSEELYVHAEKDQNNIVENDESTEVGHDRSETVGNDETISIQHDRKEDVGNNETISIGTNRLETVGVDETVTIGSNQSVTVGLNKMETVLVNKSEAIGAAKELTIGGLYTVTVGDDQTTTVGGDQTLSVGSNLTIDAGEQITLQTGLASIVMTMDGTINISGLAVNITSIETITETAPLGITMTGMKVVSV